MSIGYNPDFNPTGIEGGVDTNHIPWIDLPQAPGLSIKPLRASYESGMFSTVARLAQGSKLNGLVHLGAMDLMVLSGHMTYADDLLTGDLTPGVWGYVPANAKIDGLTAHEDTEFLANFYGPVAFLGEDGQSVTSVLTSLDIQAAAQARGVTLVPNTLAECMQPRPARLSGPAGTLGDCRQRRGGFGARRGSGRGQRGKSRPPALHRHPAGALVDQPRHAGPWPQGAAGQ